MKQTIYSLQYLRFFAAILVVLAHTTDSLYLTLSNDNFGIFTRGGRGVDIFFVISGFIMIYITQNKGISGFQFIISRLTRVAPLYWFFTSLMIFATIFLSGMVNSNSIDLYSILTSYIFIPWVHPSNGDVQPILRQGWTLNLEFFFYIIFYLGFLNHRLSSNSQ